MNNQLDQELIICLLKMFDKNEMAFVLFFYYLKNHI